MLLKKFILTCDIAQLLPYNNELVQHETFMNYEKTVFCKKYIQYNAIPISNIKKYNFLVSFHKYHFIFCIQFLFTSFFDFGVAYTLSLLRLQEFIHHTKYVKTF